ncbi:MAG: hypothetical protein EA425_09785 [Puniceicoccaceae bacterium]|nr:MAG: hypothetical protein EA425_09785 [Puniceicoccaceae bacterium]
MPFSDEPQVIKDRPPLNRSNTLLILGVFLLVGLVLVTSLIPAYRSYLKRTTPHGINHGSIYTIDLEGRSTEVEIGRYDWVYFGFWMDPIPPRPQEVEVLFTIRGLEERFRLGWNPEGTFFGPTEMSFDVYGDFHMTIEITRAGERIWSGRRWAFGEEGHHHH